ncbi:MAG: alpha-L-rhamnosidase C-terminal domain-containing protein, partial [Bacteroidota bacterium]
ELLIKNFQSEYSGYPYPELSTFESDNERLNEIFDICIQTFRMCSGETYYDTPYYEQLSYGGDNRPIAAISMYNSSDDRLFREVMRLYPQSKNKETQLFKSAYPSRFDFDMGSWSLAWIQSLYDYYMVRGDADYVAQFVDDMEGVLKFYERNLDESMNILGSVRNQNFMDWSISKGSIPRKNEAGVMHHSLMLSMYYVHTLDCASALYGHLGKSDLQKKWSSLAAKMKAAVRNHGWNEEKQLIADHPGGESFSQHTNLLAILSDVMPTQDQAAHLRHILAYEDFTEYASSYFSFILFKAMQKTGQEELFLDHLDFWYTYLDRGHTTAGETGFASHDRSDCHAWSAHPAYYLLNFVCGIKPASIGFETVEISPELGDLKKIEASMPHKKGRIEVSYELSKSKLSGYVILPEGLAGTWNYQGVSKELVSGKNIIKQ